MAPLLAAGAASAAVSILGGMFKKRSANKQARLLEDQARARDAAEQADRQRMTGAMTSGIQAMQQKYGNAYAFRPVTARSAYGSAGYDAQGNLTSTLSPELQQATDQYGNLANEKYGLLQGYNREAEAQKRMGMYGNLTRAGDQQSQESFFDAMRKKGVLGLSTKDYQTGGMANPYATSFESARAQRDAGFALNAADYADQNYGQMLGQYGLLRQGQQTTMGLGQQNMAQAAQAQQMFQNQSNQQARTNMGLDQSLLQSQVAGLQQAPGAGYWEAMQGGINARAQGQQGLISGFQQGGQALVGGMFGQGGPFGPKTPLPAWNFNPNANGPGPAPSPYYPPNPYQAQGYPIYMGYPQQPQ